MMAGQVMMDQSLPSWSKGLAEHFSTTTFVNNQCNSVADMMESDLQEEGLDFDNTEHPSDVLVAMGNLRRQNQFCDAILRVGEKEVLVHRAVLAASSPFLFEMFERAADTHYSDNNRAHHSMSMYKLKDVTFAGFSYLLDYMYSGRLKVGAQDVGEVYRTAKLLRMEQATQACSAFLADRLTPSNCLDIRVFAEDPAFGHQIDGYIQSNMENVLKSKQFLSLPELRVEIIGAEEAMENEGRESQLFSLVLDWARTNFDNPKFKVDLLTEEVNVLFLNAENHLQDCKDIDDSRMSDDDVVVDYKKHSRRRSTLTHKKQVGVPVQQPAKGGNQPMPFHVFDIKPEGGVLEKEWAVIATLKQKGNSYVGLAVMCDSLLAVSVHLRPVSTSSVPASPGSTSPTPDNQRRATLQPLATMASSRCAFGVCVWNDTIVVCGGYDRGECLASVEVYNPGQGRWTSLPSMLTPRARFGAAAIQGRLFAIGGSDGARDLDSVHCLDLHTNKWAVAAPLRTARSSVGAAELFGKLYCVGGMDGQHSFKTCEVYSMEKNQWSFIAPLNTARHQASVTAFGGSLMAVGGTDSWNCLNSVEMYQPAANAWTYITALTTMRRGAGIDVVDGQLLVVGGSDGASSLRTTEVFDGDSQSWSLGPAINCPRANVAAVSVGGSLYALGGFSGKKFLNSMELLQPGSTEWSTCQPALSRRNSSGDEQVRRTTSSLRNELLVDSDMSSSDQDSNSGDEGKSR